MKIRAFLVSDPASAGVEIMRQTAQTMECCQSNSPHVRMTIPFRCLGTIPQHAVMRVRHVTSTIFNAPDFAAAGGLMSDACKLADMYGLDGSYTGRILK